MSTIAACGGEIDDDPTAVPSREQPECVAPGTTRQLVSAPNFYPMNLVSNGEVLYAGGITEPGYRVELWSAPLTMPVSTAVADSKYANGPMAIGPHGSVVYLSGGMNSDSNAVSARPTGVVMRDASGRNVPIVEGGAETLSNIVADHNGVSWVTASSVQGGRPNLWRWDVATGQKRVLGETNFNPHLGDESEIFHAEWNEGTGTIVATSVSGGVGRVVGKVGPVESSPVLVAVDSVALYYLLSNAEGSLYVMSKTSGEVTRVITGVSVPSSGAADDDTHLYWAEQSQRLLRLEKATGVTEELLRTDNLGPALAIDACNSYYSAGVPPAVFARGK